MLKIITIIFLVALFGWYLSFLATRLDRLHHRVETSWEHLDAQLQKRAAIALEIAHSRNLDPASGYLLTQAAYDARSANFQERSDAESSLSQTLNLLLESEDASNLQNPLFTELAELTLSINRSITIHLEAVNTAKRLRKSALVRIFHLAGHAPDPIKYSFEDEAVF